MGMFGKLGASPREPLNSQDRLMMLGATLKDTGNALRGSESDTIMQMQSLIAQRQQQAMKQQFAQQLAGRLGPQYAETQGAGAAIQQPSMPGMPQAEAAPDYQWQAPQRTSDGLNINSPDLPQLQMQAELAGYDMKGLIDTLDKQRPAWQMGADGNPFNTRGSSAPRAAAINGIRPTADGGAEPVRGYADALAGIEGAKAGAIARAQSPYEFVNVPTPTGAPGLAAKSALVGGTFTGQAPDAAAAARIKAEAGANRDVEMPGKIATITSQLQTLGTMKELLPNIIAGFGAGPLLQVARVKAATGDPKAIAQVKATETFINQGRQLVTTIIKQFGANPTEGERKYAEKMAGADADLNPQTLAEGIRLAEQRAYRDLQTVQNGGRSPAAPPAVGAVVKGYRYKGGDPSKPSSWVRN